jgi:CDP-diacylglycerol--glycerol-3-phosphate 3-phosphatidyltransferase
MTIDSRLNPPNVLTLLRILAIPVLVLILIPPAGREISFARSVAAFLLFVAATLTDLFDGYIARRYRMVTSLGKLLDPLADKLLVCAAMVMLIPPERVPAWMAVIVVAREIGVTALRGMASTEGVVIAASRLGKAKTLLLNIGMAMLILHYPVFGLPVHDVGFVVLSVGLVLTAWSGLDYFFRFVGEIFKR